MGRQLHAPPRDASATAGRRGGEARLAVRAQRQGIGSGVGLGGGGGAAARGWQCERSVSAEHREHHRAARPRSGGEARDLSNASES